MLELRVLAGDQLLSPFDLPAVLGRSMAVREIGNTVDALIAFMDDLDGDPDLEETDAEDSFVFSSLALQFAFGPGCIASDNDNAVDDVPCDPHDEDGE